MTRSKTSPTLINTAERRARALELRKGGGTFRQIASAIIDKYGADRLPRGYDERYAWMDVKAELDKLRETMKEDAQDVFQLHLERYNAILAGHYVNARQGNVKAAGVVLRTMERIEKLYGLEVLRTEATTENVTTFTVQYDD